MPIWRLEPLDLSSEYWAYSRYSGVAIVLVGNADKARFCAVKAFSRLAEIPRSRKTPRIPWQDADLVRCSQVVDSTFNQNGPSCVLDPPHYGE